MTMYKIWINLTSAHIETSIRLTDGRIRKMTSIKTDTSASHINGTFTMIARIIRSIIIVTFCRWKTWITCTWTHFHAVHTISSITFIYKLCDKTVYVPGGHIEHLYDPYVLMQSTRGLFEHAFNWSCAHSSMSAHWMPLPERRRRSDNNNESTFYFRWHYWISQNNSIKFFN